MTSCPISSFNHSASIDLIVPLTVLSEVDSSIQNRNNVENMPSDSAYWLISAPHRRGDDQDLFRSVKSVVGDNVAVGGLEIPDLKVSSATLR